MATTTATHFLFVVFLISSATLFTVCRAREDPEVEDQSHFTYGAEEKNGPHKWGQLNPKWSACSAGKLQSPIDMFNKRVQVQTGDLLHVKYKPALANVTNRGHDIAICNEINTTLANFWWGSGAEEVQKKRIHWISWKQLCKSKQDGGLGFRDMHTFNQALLCKQAWKLISEPSSPMAMVFKARYYPQGDFWTASLGTKPSYTWRSILSVRDLVYQGIKWKLANGTQINIWSHNWVNHTSTGKVITRPGNTVINMHVSDLIDSEIGVWKLDLLRNLFLPIDCESILQLPLNMLDEIDSPIWRFTTKGDFTVKTAYHFILASTHANVEIPGCSENKSNIFLNLWNLRIPKKICHFLFRCIHNRLATIDNLKKRKLQIGTGCCLCSDHEESIMHVLNHCKYTQAVLEHIQGIPDLTHLHNFMDLYEKMYIYLPSESFRLWVVCIWDIWYQRNRKIHDQVFRTPPEVLKFAELYLHSTDSAATVLANLRPPDALND